MPEPNPEQIRDLPSGLFRLSDIPSDPPKALWQFAADNLLQKDISRIPVALDKDTWEAYYLINDDLDRFGQPFQQHSELVRKLQLKDPSKTSADFLFSVITMHPETDAAVKLDLPDSEPLYLSHGSDTYPNQAASPEQLQAVFGFIDGAVVGDR